jgi:isocitrate dehydrogenase
MKKTIESKVVTYDFAQQMSWATEVKSSGFAQVINSNL